MRKMCYYIKDDFIISLDKILKTANKIIINSSK